MGHDTKLVLVPDMLQPLEQLAARLGPAEQADAARRRASERQQRQFVLGRLAARAAVEASLADTEGPGPDAGGGRAADIQVLTGASGEPRAVVDGVENVIGVSVAHAGRLACACAWPARVGRPAGVDVERVRATGLAQSRYAFCRRERALLAAMPDSQGLSGMAAWTAKEAVWKALAATGSEPGHGPAGLEVRTLSLAHGLALVAWQRRTVVRVRLSAVRGPDGLYLLAVAHAGRRPVEARES